MNEPVQDPNSERATRKARTNRYAEEAGSTSPAPSLGKRIFYRVIQNLSRFATVIIYDLRCLHRERTRLPGAAIILATHQSHFDPVLIGATFDERLCYLARKTLFKNRLFGLLIEALDAIELDRDRSGLAGLKETLKRLKQGKKVLVFPEGTRTSDGRIAKLKPGFLSVARRSRVPLIPVAISGAYEALPRTSLFPCYYPLRVAVGQAILPDEYLELEDTELLDLVAQRLHRCYDDAQASR